MQLYYAKDKEVDWVLIWKKLSDQVKKARCRAVLMMLVIRITESKYLLVGACNYLWKEETSNFGCLCGREELSGREIFILYILNFESSRCITYKEK